MRTEPSGRRNGGDEGPSVRTGLPVSRLAWLAVILAVVLMGLFTLRQVASPDIGFHLSAGNHILEGNGWPRTDPFTFTVSDHVYIDTSWGYQVVLSVVERVFGTSGMVLMHVVLVLALFSLLILTARIVPGSVHLLALLLLLGGLAAEPRFEVRPEIWSYTLLALVLYLLHRHAEGLASPLWLLPAIFLVWANSHSLFILGWAATGCFVIGLWLRRRRLDRRLLGWAALGFVAGFVNPYGWHAVLFPFTLSTRMQEENVFAGSIGEFGSPLRYATSDQLTYYLVPLACFFALVALVLLSLRRLLRQRRFWCLLLCLAFLPLALAMVRNVPLLTVACLPGTVWGLSVDRLMDVIGLHGRGRRWLGRVVVGLMLVVAAVFALRVINDAYYIAGRRLERFGLGWNALALPVGAAAHAESVGLRGRVLNHLNFGGYLMWARREPVFIDGRLEVMGESFYEEYRKTLDSKAGLESAVARYGIDWIVFPYRLRPDLLRGLSGDRDWRLAYVDPLAAIFVKEADGTDALVHRSALDVSSDVRQPPRVDELPGLGGVARPGKRERWFAGLLRRQRYPTEAFNRGVFHFYRAEPGRAVRAFAEAIEQSGGAYYEIYNNLGSTLFAMGRFDEARECYRIVLQELPTYRGERRQRVRDRLTEIRKKGSSLD